MVGIGSLKPKGRVVRWVNIFVDRGSVVVRGLKLLQGYIGFEARALVQGRVSLEWEVSMSKEPL